jgi:hypothetical protein
VSSEPLPHKWNPVILSIDLTPDLYHLVIVSVAPGRRRALMIGPRGITASEAGANALELLDHINTLNGGGS